jgi:hypothetical protein
MTTPMTGGEDGAASLFVEPISWMADTVVGAVQGKLYCPGCSARMGSFNWSGVCVCVSVCVSVCACAFISLFSAMTVSSAAGGAPGRAVWWPADTESLIGARNTSGDGCPMLVNPTVWWPADTESLIGARHISGDGCPMVLNPRTGKSGVGDTSKFWKHVYVFVFGWKHLPCKLCLNWLSFSK